MRRIAGLALLVCLMGSGAAACDFGYPADKRAESVQKLKLYPVVVEIRFERFLRYRENGGQPKGVALYRIVRSWKGPPVRKKIRLRFFVETSCDRVFYGEDFYRVLLTFPKDGAYDTPSQLEWFPDQEVVDEFEQEKTRLETQAISGDTAAAAALSAFRKEWGIATR